MSERPFMQLYVSDFIGDTLHLSTEQIGAYMLLLMAMWNSGGKLPADDAKLARVARMSVKKWKVAAAELMPFFVISDGVISHNRLTKELQKSESKSQLRASAGAEGGKAKALKNKEPTVANANGLLQHLPDTITREEDYQKTPARVSSAPADFDQLASQIEAVAPGKIQPTSLLVIGPIVEMIQSGVSLELDILPSIKAQAARSNRTLPLAYFLPGIRQAYEARIGASKGLPKPDPIDESDEAWTKRLVYCRKIKKWQRSQYGPLPGEVGCRVPARLLIPGDGEGWQEYKQ